MENVSEVLFGNDPKVQKVLDLARKVAVTKVPMVVCGEAGVGKQSLTRYIHNNSTRCDQQFKIVDCSEDAQTVENNILGYREPETGSFIKGALESVNGGTVVLSNIEGLDEAFQKKLHKILTELEDYDIDVRFLATTTKNLTKLVGSGRFYRGLYTLMSVNTVTIPPLRERLHDFGIIVEEILTNLSTDKPIILKQEALDKMISHYWTNNLKELTEVLTASIEEESNTITLESLVLGEKKMTGISSEDDSEGIHLMSLKEAEKLLIKKALIHTSENRTQAAKILGVSIRTLRNKINEYRNNGSSFFVNLR